jgi:transcriptional regulator with XRE-family HTH domain
MEMFITSTVADRLRFLRKTKGLKQEEFATLVGITKRALGSYERSEREMSIGTAAQICNKLKVSADFLILGKSLNTERTRRMQLARDNATVNMKTNGGRLEATISIPVLPELEEL